MQNNLSNNEELIRKAYEAFNRRDSDAVLALMQEDVDWPNGWEGGYVQGKKAVRAYWQRQWQEIDPEVTPVSVYEQNGKWVTEVAQVIKDKAGKLLHESRLLHVYEIQDGLIRRMEIREA